MVKRPRNPRAADLAEAVHDHFAAKPEKKVRRRRCALPTCNELYRPVKRNQRFCSIECKHEYHFKSETFSKVKREVLALIDREVRIRLERFEVRMLDVVAKMYDVARPSVGPCIRCRKPGRYRVYAPAPVAEWAGQSQADFCEACYGGPIGHYDAK